MLKYTFHRTLILPALLISLFGLIGCSAPAATAVPTVSSQSTSTPAAQAPTFTPAPSLTPTASLSYPADWRKMPVIPEVSPRMLEVYQRGQALGRDARVFSVVGDCQNVAAYFLEIFDFPGKYNLGEYLALQDTIDWYSGSFSRSRAAVKGGYNVAAVLSPLWSDPQFCDSHESPLACEFRRSNPSVVIISMETWWYDRPASTYAGYLRQIIEYTLSQGIVPILATKADNLEGDNSINAAIVQVAQEYEVPLWNFWLAVDPLPGHGLTADGFHLRFAENFFNDSTMMQHGWPVRNLTALQALDAVRHALSPTP
jgi:hypothetical protein